VNKAKAKGRMKNAEKQSERASRLKAAFPDRRLQAARRFLISAFCLLPFAFLSPSAFCLSTKP
jgi:hypothetical protein